MTNKYQDAIEQSYRDGRINEYLYKRLLKIENKGVSDKLANELVQDAEDASGLGVNNEQDYNVYFFIWRMADDIAKDTFGVALDETQKKDLYKFLFSERKDINNLTDCRILIHKWLCDRLSKKAHPNIGGKNEREPVYKMDRWISTLKNIYAAINKQNAARKDAINYFTNGWDTDEKYKFIHWMKYYEGGNAEKYNVKNAKLTKLAIEQEVPIPSSWFNKTDRGESTPHMSTYEVRPPLQKTQKELDLERARAIKKQMRSRVSAFKKLLDQYNEILPKQNIEHIYNEVYTLDKALSRLDVYASIQDCIFRTANKIRKFGFSEGAEFIEKIAEDPIPQKDVMQSMPEGISDQSNLPAGMPAINIKTIIDRLEGLSKTLKSRDMIRELASIDILLNELGLASYFPELSLAQSKLIEAYGYSSSKVEDIIAKLRGSGKGKPIAPVVKPPEVKVPEMPTPGAPVIPPEKAMNTGEIMSKPVAEVQKELPKAPEKVAPAPVTPKGQ